MSRAAPTRPAFWRDVRVVRVVLQLLFLALVVAVLAFLYANLVSNLRRRGIRTDFGFLNQPAGFAITGTDFRSTQSVRAAILTGLGNTLRVSVAGVLLATLLGTLVGIARLSTNWLVRRGAALFVEAFRNVPLLVLLIFFYIAVLQRLPGIEDSIEALGLSVLSQEGLYLPWTSFGPGAAVLGLVLLASLVPAGAVAWWRTRRFDATGAPHHRVVWAAAVILLITGGAWVMLGFPVTITVPAREGRVVTGGLRLTIEYGALLIGLILYTAAFVAEIVRGSIQSVPRGQTEAATAVGLSSWQRLRFVVLPQAMRIAVPPTGNEFLNLTKNSALGIAIAFPELLRITRIVIGNGQPAPQAVAIMMALFLFISLVISTATNIVNRLLQRRGSR